MSRAPQYRMANDAPAGTGNSWLSGKKGVAICRSTELTTKIEKDWNVFLKCNSGTYVNLIAMICLSS